MLQAECEADCKLSAMYKNECELIDSAQMAGPVGTLDASDVRGPETVWRREGRSREAEERNPKRGRPRRPRGEGGKHCWEKQRSRGVKRREASGIQKRQQNVNQTHDIMIGDAQKEN